MSDCPNGWHTTHITLGDGTRVGKCGMWFRNRTWFFDCGECGQHTSGHQSIRRVSNAAARHVVHCHQDGTCGLLHPHRLDGEG